MTQQGCQLVEVDEIPINNLDWAGKVPRDSDKKGSIFLIGSVYSPLSARSSYQRWATSTHNHKKEFLNVAPQGEFEEG
jgi:hypothetical protein